VEGMASSVTVNQQGQKSFQLRKLSADALLVQAQQIQQ